MPLPAFDDLPFNARPDLTPYLLHLTTNTSSVDEYSADDNLVSILRAGEVWGSTPTIGKIKGRHKAACFMDVPFASLEYVTKRYAYGQGCRPVLYLSDAETTALDVPPAELWRVVRFEVSKRGWISWLHEREWRCKGSFRLPETSQAVVVRSTREAQRLTDEIAKDGQVSNADRRQWSL